MRISDWSSDVCSSDLAGRERCGRCGLVRGRDGGRMSGTPILFVDRDGTLIEEPADFQVDTCAKVRLVAGVIPAMLRLRDAGYAFVIVTNQDGLGSPSFPREAFDAPQAMMLQLFESQGIVRSEEHTSE